MRSLYLPRPLAPGILCLQHAHVQGHGRARRAAERPRAGGSHSHRLGGAGRAQEGRPGAVTPAPWSRQPWSCLGGPPVPSARLPGRWFELAPAEQRAGHTTSETAPRRGAAPTQSDLAQERNVLCCRRGTLLPPVMHALTPSSHSVSFHPSRSGCQAAAPRRPFIITLPNTEPLCPSHGRPVTPLS